MGLVVSEPVPIPACVHRVCGRLTAALVLLLPLLLISPPAAAPTDHGLACRDPGPFGPYDPLLGPWPVEGMLQPYPSRVFNDDPPASPVPPRSVLHRALIHLKGSAVTIYHSLGAGARVARVWFGRFERLLVPQLELIAPPPALFDGRGPLRAPDGFDDLFNQGGWLYGPGPSELRGVLDDHDEPWRSPVWAHGTFSLDGQAAAADAADGLFGVQTLPTYADIVLPHETLAILAPRPVRPAPKRHPVDPVQVALQMTAIFFLATVILVPFGCSFAAGALYGHPRDGPHADGSAAADRSRAASRQTGSTWILCPASVPAATRADPRPACR